ncbi:MAG: single-stranded DNA-binding protein [Acidimicrobiales bacterium]|nr:single-stranded DNA-binding protein [Acidimicrobiales bacterium]
MAINGATITVVGNCTRDPELRFTNSGLAVASFGLAVNFRKMNRQTGEWEEEDPSFFNVTAFGQLGENVAESVAKGSRVVVVGRLRIRNWEGNEGERRTSAEIVADEVAPSLRFATAEITKTERRYDDGASGGGDRSGNRGSGIDDIGAFDPDEEPF